MTWTPKVVVNKQVEHMREEIDIQFERRPCFTTIPNISPFFVREIGIGETFT